MRPCLSCASAARVLGGVCTYERLRGASALGKSHMRTHAHTEGSMDNYLQHHSFFGTHTALWVTIQVCSVL